MKKEMKRSKRVLALILAICCMLSVNMTAWAAGNGSGYLDYSPYYDREVYVDGEFVEPYGEFKWTIGGQVIVSFRENGEEIIPYALEIYHDGDESANVYTELPGADILYEPESSGYMSMYVYWTQEEYEYAMFYPEDESECIVEYFVDGNGSATHQSVSGERVMTCNNRTKVILPVDVMELTFNVEPADGEEVEFCAYWDEEMHPVTDIQNGQFTVPLEYYDTYVEIIFTRDSMPAENPGVYLEYDPDRIAATINGEELEEAYVDYFFEEHPADSYTIEFTNKNGDWENDAIRGIAVEQNGQIFLVKNDEDSADYMQYVIEDPSQFYRIGVINFNYPFQNEMLVEYDSDCGKVFVNGEFFESYHTSAVDTDALEFTFDPNKDGAYPYAVHIYNEFEGEFHTEMNLSKKGFSYTPETESGFFVKVYWTQEEYEFAMTTPEDEQIQIELYVSGNGTITPLVSDEAEVKIWKNAIKIIMPHTEEIDLQVEPMEGEEFEFAWFYDREYYPEDVKDGILTLQLNPDERWFGGDIVFTQNKEAPGFVVARDTEFVRVECNGEVFGNEDYDRYFEVGEGECVLTFTGTSTNDPNGEHSIRGIAVKVDGERQFIKNENPSKPMQYIISDTSKWYEIEVITWDTPFNGELIAYYRDNGKLYINGGEYKSDLTYEVPDGEMTLSFEYAEGNNIPYSVTVWDCVTDECVISEIMPESALTFVPEGEHPYLIEICWTKEEYDYVNLQEQEGEKVLWYAAHGDGSVSHVAIEGERSASMDNYTKVVIPCTTKSVQFQITPGEGQRLDAIYMNGQTVPLYKVQNGILTLDYSNSDEQWKEVEFVFAEIGDEPPVEGNIGDVTLDGTVDTSDAQYIFNHFMGIMELSDEAYALADITGDGAVDTSDAQAAFNIFMGI